MARPPRLQAEDCFYHITSRGDDRKPIFRSERDYQKFLEYLALGREKYKYYIHVYCLMTNHYHLLVETTLPNLSRIMQYLNTAYTVYYNVKRKKSGHLFQGRYKSIIVESDAYYAELTRYMHLNPVRAKMTLSPDKYPWSSYNAYIRGERDPVLDIQRIKDCLGMDLKKYRQFVESKIEDCPNPLKDAYGGFILGSVQFIKDKLNELNADVEIKDFAHKRAVKNIIEPDDIISVVASCYKITPEILKTSVHRPMTAKKIAIYFLCKKTGLTNEQIGKIFNMSSAAVSMAAVCLVKEMVADNGTKKIVERVDCSFKV